MATVLRDTLYNTTSGVLTEREDEEENENNDEELKKYLIKIGNEYQEKLIQGKKIYKMLVSYYSYGHWLLTINIKKII